MYLSGNVVVVSTDGSKLQTDWLHYKKKEDLVVSSAPILHSVTAIAQPGRPASD